MMVTIMLYRFVHMLWGFTGSLRFKLSFYVGLVMFVTLVAFTYHTISSQREHLVNARVQSATKDSEVIKAAIWNGMMTKDREVIRQIVSAIGKQEGFKEINIYDRTGVLHYTSRPDKLELIGSTINQGQTDKFGDIANDTSVRYLFSDADQVLTVINPLINTRSCSTAECHAHPETHRVLGALEVNLPMHGLLLQLQRNARETVVFAFLLFLFISTIIGTGVIFLVSHPIRKLRLRAQKMARGEYAPEGPPKRRDSIAELTRAFEEMSRQIVDRTRQVDQGRKLYKELFEKVPCYLTVLDRDYRIVRANQAFKDEFGDHVGKHCFKGYKGLQTKCENCLVEKTFADGAPHRSRDIWSMGSQEKKAYVIVNTAPIFDSTGKVSEVLEMSVDVTRLEKLQLELNKKEQQFRDLFENVPCYLTVIDRSMRIAFYNKVFGRDFGENWGRKCFKVFKNREVKCDNCPVEKTFGDGESHSSEEVWQRDNEDIHVVLNTSPITDDAGRIVAVMEMATNITELKLLQNELSILGETIAGMSHAVRNILSGLEGGVYVVDSGLKAGKEEKVRTGWAMVKKNVEKVSDLVKDILYASKERCPVYRECDPAEVLTDVFDLYYDKACEKGIQLVKDFPSTIGSALIDPNGIHSAVSNLVSNAIAACTATTQSEGPRIILHGHMKDQTLSIQVSDNGCGIPDDVKHGLFTKFYSTKGPKGTGLGLVVTKKIIEEHKGSLRVVSCMGEGASFFIDLPMRSAGSENTFKNAV